MGFDPPITGDRPSFCAAPGTNFYQWLRAVESCPTGDDIYPTIVAKYGRFYTIDRGAPNSPRYCHYEILGILDQSDPIWCQYRVSYVFFAASDDAEPPLGVTSAVSPGGLVGAKYGLTDEHQVSNSEGWCSCRDPSNRIGLLISTDYTIPIFLLFFLDVPPHLLQAAHYMQQFYC